MRVSKWRTWIFATCAAALTACSVALADTPDRFVGQWKGNGTLTRFGPLTIVKDGKFVAFAYHTWQRQNWCGMPHGNTVRYLASDLGKENIRVNAVSAGPVKTLAASGISNFDAMMKHVAESVPRKRGVDADEVGDAVMFLLSQLSRGITGDVIHVDAGFSVAATA